jgi:hypothetical protein
MPLNYPEPMDDEGNIYIHVHGAFAGHPFAMRQAGGKVIDISATPLFFEVPATGFRRALALHPSDPKARWIPALTKAECSLIPHGSTYIIFNEESGQPIPEFGAIIRKHQ